MGIGYAERITPADINMWSNRLEVEATRNTDEQCRAAVQVVVERVHGAELVDVLDMLGLRERLGHDPH